MEVGNTILYDFKMLESAAETTLLVLVESAGEVGYDTIQKEITVCKQQGTKVIGAEKFRGDVIVWGTEKDYKEFN